MTSGWGGEGDKLMLHFTALHFSVFYSSELKIMSVVSAELAHTFLFSFLSVGQLCLPLYNVL